MIPTVFPTVFPGFHLNGTTLVTASDDRTVKLWVRATESDTSGSSGADRRSDHLDD